MSRLPHVECYKIKMVESIKPSTREQRIQWIEKAQYNLFNLKSEQVFIDLLTDSGTGAMSDKQWGAMMEGDESYAGSSSFFNLKQSVEEITGFRYLLPTHQGRAAENVLFSVMIKEGDIVPGNTHFDTTKGHIEFRKAIPVDCTIDEAFDTQVFHPFKGDLDISKLEAVVKQYGKERIPMVIVTATCNSAGGQPVSLGNMKAVAAWAKSYGIPVYVDGARFAENAYFIKQREEAYANHSIKEIVKEFFSYAEGMTMSSKKDGIVNMGGFIALNNEQVYKDAAKFEIIYEGYLTYGGMTGRSMNALAVGLQEVTEMDYLETRIGQIAYLGAKLREYQVPIQEPIGGHAIFVDAKRFLPQVPKEEYIAQTLALELYIEAGVRGVEIGTLLADRDPVTRENRYPKLEFLRLAIPRRVYTNSHMDYIAMALKNVYERRDAIKTGYVIESEAPILRHFTVGLKKK